jgi:hypothetical protein
MDPPDQARVKLAREPFRRVMKAALDDCLAIKDGSEPIGKGK